MTVRHGIGYIDIRLNTNTGIPDISFLDYAYLLNCETIWNRSMQINLNIANLRQEDRIARYIAVPGLMRYANRAMRRPLQRVWRPNPYIRYEGLETKLLHQI